MRESVGNIFKAVTCASFFSKNEAYCVLKYINQLVYNEIFNGPNKGSYLKAMKEAGIKEIDFAEDPILDVKTIPAAKFIATVLSDLLKVRFIFYNITSEATVFTDPLKTQFIFHSSELNKNNYPIICGREGLPKYSMLINEKDDYQPILSN